MHEAKFTCTVITIHRSMSTDSIHRIIFSRGGFHFTSGDSATFSVATISPSQAYYKKHKLLLQLYYIRLKLLNLKVARVIMLDQHPYMKNILTTIVTYLLWFPVFVGSIRKALDISSNNQARANFRK